MAVTETPSYILNNLPYTMPTTGWIIHRVASGEQNNKGYPSVVVECPLCHKHKKKKLQNILYKRSKKCIVCQNKQMVKKSASRKLLSVKIETSLFDAFREKLEAEDKLVTHVMADLIKEYLIREDNE